MEVKFGADSGLGTTVAEGVDETSAERKAEELEAGGEIKPSAVTNSVLSQLPATTAPGVFRLGDRLPGFADVILPRLNIVYSVGELGKSFPAGAIVFNKETVLYTPPIIDAQQGVIVQAALPPVVLYVIGIVSERFSEKIQGGLGGEIVNSEAEVRAAGGTLDYKEWNLKKSEGMRRFEPLIDLLIAIEKPAHVSDPDGATFGFTVGDRELTRKQYAIGFWGCKGVSYTHAVKRVFNMHRLTGVLRGGYYTHSFAVSTRQEKFTTPTGTFSAPVPVCVPKAKTTPEVLEFIRGIVGA